MKILKALLILIFPFLLLSCGTLRPVEIIRNADLSTYKYFYMNNAPTKLSNDGSAVVFNYGYVSYAVSNGNRSFNPSEFINGNLTRRGFIRVPEILTDQIDKTFIVNFAETNRYQNDYGTEIEITVQIIAAKNYELLCTCKATGAPGDDLEKTEIALTRCINEIFGVDENKAPILRPAYDDVYQNWVPVEE